MDATALGRTLRWARKRAGLTQQALAEAAGVPQPTVARIERGRVSPRTGTLTALLEATGHRLTIEPADPAVDQATLRRQLALAVPARTQQALGKKRSDRNTGPILALRRLRRFSVPFVLIGDLAEVAHGAPMKAGASVEICHPSTDVAAERLAQTLDDLGTADAGALAPVNETAAGDDYEVLARNAVWMPVVAGLRVHVAGIEDLIRARLARGTEQDRRAAAVLRAIAEAPPRT